MSLVAPRGSVKGEQHKEVVQILLEAKARVDLTSGACEGKTALMLAAEKGRTVLVLMLLDASANAKIRAQGQTALDLAQQGGYKVTAAALEEFNDTCAKTTQTVDVTDSRRRKKK